MRRRSAALIDERLHAAAVDADVTALRRLLTVFAGMLPFPLNLSGRDLVAEHVGGPEATLAERGRAVTGPVLWARDAYGARWAVVAPFKGRGRPGPVVPVGCGRLRHEVATVHSGFYPSAGSALADWRESVGPAAAQAALTPVDDPDTLCDLLRGEVEAIRIGGEDQGQYASGDLEFPGLLDDEGRATTMARVAE